MRHTSPAAVTWESHRESAANRVWVRDSRVSSCEGVGSGQRGGREKGWGEEERQTGVVTEMEKRDGRDDIPLMGRVGGEQQVTHVLQCHLLPQWAVEDLLTSLPLVRCDGCEVAPPRVVPQE